MEKKLTKQEFMDEIGPSIIHVTDRHDCADWWGSLIDAYIEDGIIRINADKWRNPYLKNFDF
jgi:hypothetical protein